MCIGLGIAACCCVLRGLRSPCVLRGRCALRCLRLRGLCVLRSLRRLRGWCCLRGLYALCALRGGAVGCGGGRQRRGLKRGTGKRAGGKPCGLRLPVAGVCAGAVWTGIAGNIAGKGAVRDHGRSGGRTGRLPRTGGFRRVGLCAVFRRGGAGGLFRAQ